MRDLFANVDGMYEDLEKKVRPLLVEGETYLVRFMGCDTEDEPVYAINGSRGTNLRGIIGKNGWELWEA